MLDKKESSSQARPRHRHRRDQGLQPARRRGLLLPAQADGLEDESARRAAGGRTTTTSGASDAEQIHRAAADGFGAAAGEYERARPDYPADAIEFLADRLGLGPSTTVLDLGAGTGKLTRQIVATGATVVAIEPVAAMRDQLRARSPASRSSTAPPRASRGPTPTPTRSYPVRRSTGSTRRARSSTSTGCCATAAGSA